MRSLRTRAGQVGVAIAVSATLGVGPALSQKGLPPPAADADFLLGALETCGEIIENDLTTAADNLTAAGWEVADPFENGPYLDEIAGSKDYGASGIAYVYGYLEYYADITVGYCEYEVDNPIVPIDLDALTTEYEFTGNAVTEGDGMFGAWTIVDNDITYYILASVTAELYHLQVTWILGNQSAPVGK